MNGLHWFSGITGETSMRDIGWVWLVLILGLIFVFAMAVKLWRDR